MSINLGIGAGVLLVVIGVVIWIVRRNKKYGRLESESERAVEFAESIGDINDMERAIDEEDKPDFGDTDSARDYLSGGMRDEDGDRR